MTKIKELEDNPAGVQLSFRSDTRRKDPPDMVNMTPVGRGGFDCYTGKNSEKLKTVIHDLLHL